VTSRYVYDPLNGERPTESLQQKADQIRAEQGLPPESEHSGPQPCHWYDDGHGGRYLIPGCLSRVVNPDIDVCSCKTINEQLATAHRQIADLKRERDGLQNWHDAIVRTVHDHRDGIQIMKTAADRASS
jgi:hypothetical protein